jgi:NAD(P)-dependent dehydrogenase (short-subunit alcohol dehydrogenase family)
MGTIVVTGADRGIGEAMCVQLAARGDAVIAACFDDAPRLRDGKVEVVPGIDVTSDAAVAGLTKHLGGRRVDVLVNNAGLVVERRLGEFDFDAFQREFAVNALGPLRLAQALLPQMGRGGKIALITSRVGSLSENHKIGRAHV